MKNLSTIFLCICTLQFLQILQTLPIAESAECHINGVEVDTYGDHAIFCAMARESAKNDNILNQRLIAIMDYLQISKNITDNFPDIGNSATRASPSQAVFYSAIIFVSFFILGLLIA